MNAPANIPQAKRVRFDETPAEATYRRSISMHLPNIDEQDMSVRVWLAMTRDQAVTGMAVSASPMARTILGEVMSSAAQAVFAGLPTSKLMRLKSALWLAMEAARAAERWHRDG